MNAELKSAFDRIRGAAGAYPEAYEESPWGELAVKVRKKVFVFLGRGEGGDRLTMSLKLPESRVAALELPQASPTGYGLGKHGWVSFGFDSGQVVPVQQVLDWLDESYRAVAPKRLVRSLEDRPVVEATEPTRSLVGLRLLLVGNDPLRLERAVNGLTDGGADCLCVDLDGALDAAGAGAPDGVIVDLSRQASQAVALLADLGMVVSSPILVAGVRDARMERAVREIEGLAFVSREPPGDPAFLEHAPAHLGR